MSHKITATFSQIELQAIYTTTSYMSDAIRQIDQQFGDGYARENPKLVAAFMKTCSSEMLASSILVASQKIAHGLESAALIGPENR
jgi:hypothetical protein